MGSPRIPTSAERAKSIAVRGGKAALVPATSAVERVVPFLYHVHPNGTVTLLLEDEHPLIAAVRQANQKKLAAVIELIDPAPVPLREPVRGLLWITGQLHVLAKDAARETVLAVAQDNPDPRLLDVGHGVTVLHLTPTSMVLADPENSSQLRPVEFAIARPDPFCRDETAWLRHLEVSHPDVVSVLTQHLPGELQGGHVRPLGLDRFGLRLRVEAVHGDHDVRLAFTRPVATAHELGTELRRLLGCPFLVTASRG